LGKRRRQRRRGPEPEAWLGGAALDPLDRAAAEAADRRFGPAEPRRLHAAIAGLSHGYTRERRFEASPGERPTGSRDGELEARLRFFLPRDARKILPLLGELRDRGGLPPPGAVWRVLDLGAGLGTATFAAALLAASRGSRLEAVAVDRDPGALSLCEATARRLAPRSGPAATRGVGLAAIRTVTRPLLARGEATPSLPPAPPGGWDLVLASLTLNELLEAAGSQPEGAEGGAPGLRAPPDGLGDQDASDPSRPAPELALGARLLEAWGAELAPAGTLLVVEPALRTTSQRLQGIRDHLLARPGPHPLQVFAPCTHDQPCPMRASSTRDWCHRELPDPLPSALRAMARGAGLRDRKLTFSYLALRRDRLREAGPPVLRVVSNARRLKGRTELFVCGQEGLTRLVRQHRDEKDADDDPPADALGRGDLVAVEGAPGNDPAGPAPSRRLLAPDAAVRRLSFPARKGPDLEGTET